MLEIMTAAAPALMMMVAKAGQGEGPTAPELRGGEERKEGGLHFDADSGFEAHHYWGTSGSNTSRPKARSMITVSLPYS